MAKVKLKWNVLGVAFICILTVSFLIIHNTHSYCSTDDSEEYIIDVVRYGNTISYIIYSVCNVLDYSDSTIDCQTAVCHAPQ